MIHLANILIYGGLTAAVAICVGAFVSTFAGWLAVSIGCVITGVLIAARSK